MCPKKRIKNNTPLGIPVIELSSGETFHNWDVFNYSGSEWILGVPRDGDFVELVPTSSIDEVTEIPRSEWKQLDLEEFANMLEDGTLTYSEEKSLTETNPHPLLNGGE